MAGLGVTIFGTTRGNSEIPLFLFAGGLLYAAGGPLVHVAHGRGGAAAMDLGLRLGLPFVLAIPALIVAPHLGRASRTEEDVFAWSSLSVGAGFITAISVDAAVLAREPVVADDPSAAAPRWGPRFALSPRGEAYVGVGGPW